MRYDPKASYKLSDFDQLVIRIIAASKVIEMGRLAEVVHFIGDSFDGFDDLINNLVSRLGTDYYPDEKRPDQLLAKTIQGLNFLGLVKPHESDEESFSKFGLEFEKATLTDDGHRIAEAIAIGREVILRTVPSQRETIFVACAVGKDDIDLLHKVEFVSACEDLSYKVTRVDLQEHFGTITNAIMTGITDCACIIADLTYARPSVYFEVGYAVGLGIPHLLTCRADHRQGLEDSLKVHFDLAQFNISFWNQNDKNQFEWPMNKAPKDRLVSLLG